MLNIIVEARAAVSGAEIRYGFGSTQVMWLQLRNTGYLYCILSDYI
jgi:hypothetical protein